MKINDHEVNMRKVAWWLVLGVLVGVAAMVVKWSSDGLAESEARQIERHAILVAQAEVEALPVTITPWSPGTAESPSPYVCFAAIKGETHLLALDCLDTSLTVREVTP